MDAKDGLLTGANFVDSFIESGVIKNALIKGLKANGPVIAGSQPIMQNHLVNKIIKDIENYKGD